MNTTAPVLPISANKFFPLPKEWEFFINFQKPIDKLAFANYNKDTRLDITNYKRKELFPMTIHPILHSVGAMTGGLLTLGLFAYNIISLFSPNRNSAGCSIK